QQTADGVRVGFRPGPGTEEELRALVAVETRCCPWAAWTVHADATELVLDVRSANEGIAALHAMFTGLRAPPPPPPARRPPPPRRAAAPPPQRPGRRAGGARPPVSSACPRSRASRRCSCGRRLARPSEQSTARCSPACRGSTSGRRCRRCHRRPPCGR